MALIEREALRSELLSLTYYGEGEYYSGREAERDAIIDRLNVQPTINAAPVVHARWKKRKDGTPYCSACGANERDFYDAVIEECRFCYRCGARMGGEGHEAD